LIWLVHNLCLCIRSAFHSFQIYFFHSFQFLSIDKTVTRTPWTLTLFVLWFNIPFWIFQKLVNVLTKHLFKVSVINTFLLTLSVVSRWLIIFSCCVSSHRFRVRWKTITSFH
jgi:hypothetical protein